MKRFTLLFVGISAVLSACSDSLEMPIPETLELNHSVVVNVLQERSKSCPLTDYSSLNSNSIRTRVGEFVTLDKFIGRGFKVEHYPLEHTMNLGFPIIDIDRYIRENPNSYQVVPVKNGIVKYYAYSDFSRYELATKESRKTSINTNVAFNLFKMNSELAFNKVFESKSIQESNRVFGDMTILFYDNLFEIKMPTFVHNTLEKYLKPEFIKQIYYGSTEELFKYYGGFMLTKFLSGAQAHVLYNGVYTGTEDFSSQENQMKIEMESTIFKKAGGGFKIHRDISSTTTTESVYKEMNLSILTLGGMPAFSQFSTPIAIDNVDVDLSDWTKSLSDEKSLVIAELPEESLLPITLFVEENNLKERIEQIYNYGKIFGSSGILQEPYIRIDLNPSTNGVYFITRLVTRYGEKITLGGASGSSINDIEQALTSESNRVCKLFPNLRVETHNNLVMPAIEGGISGGQPGPVPSLENKFNIPTMKKYIAPNGKTYLVTTSQVGGDDFRKIAYVLYDQNVINDYTFNVLLSRMPKVTNLDYNILTSDYYLYAL